MITRDSLAMRPFMSKAQLESEQERHQALAGRYRGLGNPDLIAAIEQMKASEPLDNCHREAAQAWRDSGSTPSDTPHFPGRAK